MTIRVLVADDHRLFRQGLISLMRTREGQVEVVGEAETGRDAVHLAEILRPDVILMDIYMPQGDGLWATAEIRELFPDIAVVILTSSEEDEHLFEAVRLGAAGYLLKSLDAEELFDLLSGVERGEAALTRAMAKRLLKSLSNPTVDAEHGQEELTDRELEVLQLVARGSSNLEIADGLCITINTVKYHLKNILSKLQLVNRTQVAAYALQRGLVQSDHKVF